MADNVYKYGFRPFINVGGETGPVAYEATVATAQSFDVNGGASNVAIRKGDPLTLLAGGTVALCDGFEGAGGGVALYAICAGISQYYDAVAGVVVKQDSLPSDVSWGTTESKKSKVFIWLLSEWKRWLICGDDTVNATRAAYQLHVGSLFDHTLANASATTLKVNPKLDMSTVNQSAAQWRLEGISETIETDFSGNNVELIVSPYELITTI